MGENTAGVIHITVLYHALRLLCVFTQPAYECFCHQRHVPQVPHVRVKVIQHGPVGPTHHAAVELGYVLTQGQEPGGPTSPLINLRTHAGKTQVQVMRFSHI